jgi:hypothetical protein
LRPFGRRLATIKYLRSRLSFCRVGHTLERQANGSGHWDDYHRTSSNVVAATNEDGRSRRHCSSVARRLQVWRFVSIVGPGGVRKITVAVSIAHALIDGFRDAVFFVDLAALTDPQNRADSGCIGTRARGAHPRPSGCPADLCWRQEDPPSARQLRSTSRCGEAPRAHILATSREALRVEGEHVYLLRSLDCRSSARPEGPGRRTPRRGDRWRASRVLTSPIRIDAHKELSRVDDNAVFAVGNARRARRATDAGRRKERQTDIPSAPRSRQARVVGERSLVKAGLRPRLRRLRP